MLSLEEYQYILDVAPCGICRVALDESLTILYANRFYYEIYGYTVENAKEEGFRNARYILPEKDYPEIYKEVLNQIKEGNRYFQLEYRGVHRTGKLLWLLVCCAYDPVRPESMVCVQVDIAQRKQMEEELRMSMEESQLAFRLTDKMMYLFDIPARRLIQPKPMADVFGMPAVVENVPNSVIDSGVISEESKEDYRNFYQAMMRGDAQGSASVKKEKKDGTFGWFSAKFSVIYDNENRPVRGIISCDDITEQRELELTYQKWSQYFKSQEGKTIGYYEYNLTRDSIVSGTQDKTSAELERIKKYTEKMLYIGEHFVCEKDREKFYRFFDRDRLLGRYFDGQRETSIEYRRKYSEGGKFCWVRAAVRMITDPDTNDVKMFLLTLNIDREKRKERKMRSRLENDAMTGILNRETFIQKASDIIGIQDYVVRHALIMIDIDRFKEQNDNFGHQFGDQVIKDTALLLKNSLRKEDLCGRIGGDEFMVFLCGITSESDVKSRIELLCQTLARIYPQKGRVSCSLGVVFYPRDGVTFKELYQNADTALYEAKRAGRANYKIYSRKLQ